MTNATRDENNLPVILGTSSVDWITPTPIKINPVTGRMLINATGVFWDVNWPSSSVNEAISIFDWTTWKTLKDSTVLISDLMDVATYDVWNLWKNLYKTSDVVYIDIIKWDNIWDYTTGRGSTNAPFKTIPYAIANSNSTNTRWLRIWNWIYLDDFVLDWKVWSIDSDWIPSIITGKITANWPTFFFNMQLIRSWVTTSETMIDMITNVSQVTIDFCLLQMTTATADIQPTIIDYDNWSVLTLTWNDFVYTNTNTGVSSSTTNLIKGTWPSFTLFNWNSFFIDYSPSSWDIFAFNDDTSLLISINAILPIMNVYNASYSWTMAFYKWTKDAINKKLFTSELLMSWNWSWTWAWCVLDSGWVWQTVKSLNNTINITWFANNLHGNLVSSADILQTFNDESNALDWVVWPWKFQQDPLWDYFNWTIEEVLDLDVDSDWATITASIQKDWWWDLTLRYSTGRFLFKSTPAATIELTAWSDEFPQRNFLYILKSNKTLTVSTVSFPTTEHTPVGIVTCQSASSLDTDKAFMVWKWQDDIADLTENWHLSHSNRKLRKLDATYEDWVLWNGTDSYIELVTQWLAIDDLFIKSTSGTIFQLHSKTFPVYNSQTWDPLYVVNDEVTTFDRITNLNSIDTDINWTTLRNNNDRYNLMIFWVISENSTDCKIYINKPNGKYWTSDLDAINDINNTTIFTIPSVFDNWAVFSIARITVKFTTASSWTFEIINTQSLLWLPLNQAIWWAWWGWIKNNYADNELTVFNVADNTKVMKFDVSWIATTTTRTLSVQDLDWSIALLENKLSVFATTTSSELAWIISDETWSWLLVFGTSPAITTPTWIVKWDVWLWNVDNIADSSQTTLWTVVTWNVDAIVNSTSVWLWNVDNVADINQVSTGALNAWSITTWFWNIDNWTSTLNTGNATATKINTAKWWDIASATTTDIWAATWNFVDITWTTTITWFWTVTAWATRTLQFDWILILTHNATSLILPTGANITTAVWDTCEMISLWSGNWICVNYQRKDWTALVGGWGWNSEFFSVTWQLTLSTSIVVIPLDTEDFDSWDNFNTTTHQYTAPSTWTYTFSYVAKVDWSLTDQDIINCIVYKNATIDSWLIGAQRASWVGAYYSTTFMYELTANDTIELRWRNIDGARWSLQTRLVWYKLD